MKRGTLNLLASMLFLVLVGAAFFLIWRNASSNAAPIVPAESYIPIDISGVKAQADKIIKTRENNTPIPIPDPTGKMGKSDPFNNPE